MDGFLKFSQVKFLYEKNGAIIWEAVRTGCIKAFDRSGKEIERNRVLDNIRSISNLNMLEGTKLKYVHVVDCFFKTEDVNSLWGKNEENGSALTANERRHYGLLKAEKDKTTEAIKASIEGLLYCQKEKNPIIKKAFLDFIDRDHPNMPQTLKDEIWRSIPRKYKSGAGRPAKTAKT
jgi:hypothetical protein